MNIPPFTFENSPIYTGALLALLILFAIIRKPTINFFKFLKKSIKSYNKKRKAKRKAKKLRKQKLKDKKEKAKLKRLEQEPIVKTIIKKEKIIKKLFKQDWTTALFTIIGSGIIINALVKNWTFLTSKYAILEDLVMGAVNHKNLATIIITIVLSGILIIIADIFEIFQKNKSKIGKIFTILLFSGLTAGALLLLLQTIVIAKLSLINTIIMGAVFILSGFLFNYRRIFKKRKEDKSPKEKQEILIKENSLNKIKEALDN